MCWSSFIDLAKWKKFNTFSEKDPSYRLVEDEPLFGILYTISVFTWFAVARECWVMAEVSLGFYSFNSFCFGEF